MPICPELGEKLECVWENLRHFPDLGDLREGEFEGKFGPAQEKRVGNGFAHRPETRVEKDADLWYTVGMSTFKSVREHWDLVKKLVLFTVYAENREHGTAGSKAILVPALLLPDGRVTPIGREGTWESCPQISVDDIKTILNGFPKPSDRGPDGSEKAGDC
jgi:hypothetical protein